MGLNTWMGYGRVTLPCAWEDIEKVDMAATASSQLSQRHPRYALNVDAIDNERAWD